MTARIEVNESATGNETWIWRMDNAGVVSLGHPRLPLGENSGGIEVNTQQKKKTCNLHHAWLLLDDSHLTDNRLSGCDASIS